MKADLVQIYLVFVMGVLGVIVSLSVSRRQERAVGFILSGLIIVSSFWLFARNLRSIVGVEVVGPTPDERARADSIARAQAEAQSPRTQYQKFALDMLKQLSALQLEMKGFWDMDWRARRDKIEHYKTQKSSMEAQFVANPAPFPDFQQSRIEITTCFKQVDDAVKSYGSYLYYAEDEDDEGMATAKYQFNKAVEAFGNGIAKATALVQQYQ